MNKGRHESGSKKSLSQNQGISASESTITSSVIHGEQNSTDKKQNVRENTTETLNYDENCVEKQNDDEDSIRRAEAFRQKPKYHEFESYSDQQSHKIGIGLYNTDEIEDLPPRHQKKVLKAYDNLREYAEELEKKAIEINQKEKELLHQSNNPVQNICTKQLTNSNSLNRSNKNISQNKNSTQKQNYSNEFSKGANTSNKLKSTFDNSNSSNKTKTLLGGNSQSCKSSISSKSMHNDNSQVHSNRSASRTSNYSGSGECSKWENCSNDSKSKKLPKCNKAETARRHSHSPKNFSSDTSSKHTNSDVLPLNSNKYSPTKNFSKNQDFNYNDRCSKWVNDSNRSKSTFNSDKINSHQFLKSQTQKSSSAPFHCEAETTLASPNSNKYLRQNSSSNVSPKQMHNDASKTNSNKRNFQTKPVSQSKQFNDEWSKWENDSSHSKSTFDSDKVRNNNQYRKSQKGQNLSNFSNPNYAENSNNYTHNYSSSNISTKQQDNTLCHSNKYLAKTEYSSRNQNFVGNMEFSKKEKNSNESKTVFAKDNDHKFQKSEKSEIFLKSKCRTFHNKAENATTKNFPQNQKYPDNDKCCKWENDSIESKSTQNSYKDQSIHNPLKSREQQNLGTHSKLKSSPFHNKYQNIRKNSDIHINSSDDSRQNDTPYSYAGKNFLKSTNVMHNQKHSNHDKRYEWENDSNESKSTFDSSKDNYKPRKLRNTGSSSLSNHGKPETRMINSSKYSDLNSYSDIPSRIRPYNASRRIYEAEKLRSAEETEIPIEDIPCVKEEGFFIHVTVSETSNNLEMWQTFFHGLLKCDNYDINYCCKFTESLILSFPTKCSANDAHAKLKGSKSRNVDIKKPHIMSITTIKYRLIKPCRCERDIIKHCDQYFEDFSRKYIEGHWNKMKNIEDEIDSLDRGKRQRFCEQHRESLIEALNVLIDMEKVFSDYVLDVRKKVKHITSMSELRELKINFSRECNSFERSLPIYSRKDMILHSVRFRRVSVVIAETGSGKSTQLVEYLLQSPLASSGTIICTQPRKIAAISLTQFVSGKIGSNVGKVVGYDVGMEKKYDSNTKIIYMTDHALLKKCLRNKNLKGISCVIIDEAHERSLYTDLLLGLLKQFLHARPDFSIIITSATIDPSVFVDYFQLPNEAVIEVPGRVYPVKVIWLDHDVDEGFMYVKESVKTAIRLHKEAPTGDILVFLTSPSEIDEAISLFKDMCSGKLPELMSLHGKSDVQDQMSVFQTNTSNLRRIIFATNSAETSLTIPGIKYVIDSGMAKEMMFYPEKNKSCLIPSLTNKSSADQRKGRAGRTQPGICYRLYSEKDYERMPNRAVPELLKTNLLNALLKVYEYGIKPANFDFVESPPKEAIIRSVDSLEMLGLIANDKLTKLGQQVVQLAIEPRLAKFVILGVQCGIGHESAIVAALVSEAGRLFLRFEDNKVKADQKKKVFCQTNGDLCTFLEVYKRWLEVSKPDRFDWCVANYVSSKALQSAAKTVKEILFTVRQELGIPVIKRYNNLAFKTNFEKNLFSSFGENLCIFSGHHQMGYYSPYFKESLFIHPSSSLKYLRINPPKFVVYTTLMETSRNFILDVTPLKEETVNKAFLARNFYFCVDELKKLQINSITLGPFGEKILTRHILGKNGCIISQLEYEIENMIKSRNFKLDVLVDKGVIEIFIEDQFREKVSNLINSVVKKAHQDLLKEEHIIKMEQGFSYICLGKGGIIHDLIMPGEFRDIKIEPVERSSLKELELILNNLGCVQSLNISSIKSSKHQISVDVTYKTVAEAQNAFSVLKPKKWKVKTLNTVPKVNNSTKPLYRLKLTWPRLLSRGSGSIEFKSENELCHASGHLGTKSVFIGNNRIKIQPSPHENNQLVVRNLPPCVNEEIFLEKIKEALDFLADLVKDVHIDRVEKMKVVESDVLEMKEQLLKEFTNFTSASKLIIDIANPTTTTKTWEAWAYFDSTEDGYRAFRRLKGRLKIKDVPVDMQEILQSQISCKRYVFKLVQKDINDLLKKQNAKLVKSCDTSSVNDGDVVIAFACSTIENLCATKQKLLQLVQGRTVECFGNRKSYWLFTESGQKKLTQIQNETKTLIVLDSEKLVIFIYGSAKSCWMAEAEIYSLLANSKLTNTKIFDLKKSHIPQGFLKELYSRYGLNLYGLVTKFNLTSASVNLNVGKLVVEGEKVFLKQVTEHLESICANLYKKQTNKNEQAEHKENGTCAICLDPLKIDCYRLEGCGHAFCKSCIFLQFECKLIPLVCAQEGCGKHFLLMDIDKILSIGNKHLKSEFYSAALKYFVSSNAGKISYCPTPDCQSIYRVSAISDTEFHCPSCSSDICTYCQSFSHKGMSCDIFQNSKTDEDYSLKVWMKENESYRKQCPNCKAAIEKFDGCNHMECLNCKKHLCWLCLKIFPSGDLVYDHLPFCPNNQGNNTD